MNLLAGITLCNLLSIACALPAQADPPNWNGFYIGANVGEASNTFSTAIGAQGYEVPSIFTNGTVPANLSEASAGVIGSLDAGYNWSLQRNYVIGIEADIQKPELSDRAQFVGTQFVPILGANEPFDTSVSNRIDWLGTVRGRAGISPFPNLLVYGTGGLAYGHSQSNFSGMTNIGALLAPYSVCSLPGFDYAAGITPACASGHAGRVSVGWAAGAGIEWEVWGPLSVKAEYLHADLGSRSISNIGSVPSDFYAVFNTKTLFYANIIRLGLNYHFD